MKAGTESSHNLTGAKTILSVRALSQHLFVLEKMILTLIKILFKARKHFYDSSCRALQCVFFPITIIHQNTPLFSTLSSLFVLTLLRQNGDKNEKNIENIVSFPVNAQRNSFFGALSSILLYRDAYTEDTPFSAASINTTV